jgi:uncharacterized protein (DUF433 family)
MFDRIVSDPGILAGKPHIRGTRISVAMILEWLASGGTTVAIVEAYPHLAPADVEQAVRYAARFLENEVVVTAEVGA